MQVHITSRKCEIDDDLKAVVTKKVGTLKRYFDRVDQIDVVFTGEKHRRRVVMKIHSPTFYLSVSAEGDDELYTFDKALKTAQRQLKSEKGKMVDRKKRGAPEKDAIPADTPTV